MEVSERQLRRSEEWRNNQSQLPVSFPRAPLSENLSIFPTDLAFQTGKQLSLALQVWQQWSATPSTALLFEYSDLLWAGGQACLPAGRDTQEEGQLSLLKGFPRRTCC